MRRLHRYVEKYGPEAGPKLFHALQSQAGHASVSARLRRKIDVLTGKAPAPARTRNDAPLPLFHEETPAPPAEAEVAPMALQAVGA